MDKEKYLKRINELIELGIASIREGPVLDVDRAAFKQFRVEGYTFIELVYGTEHRLYSEFINSSRLPSFFLLQESICILRAIRSNIEGGWLTNQRGLLAAEIFEDVFEMAEHLLMEGYKDAAAVMIGSMLEQRLKDLATQNEIATHREKDGESIPLKAELLNQELYKKSIYNLTDQKQVTAWLGLRNSAAHGKYNDYDAARVSLMLDGARNFTSRIT